MTSDRRNGRVGVDDSEISRIPETVGLVMAEARALGFSMASDPMTGALLRTLAASKPGGSLLELGTGTGVGAAWLLAGMNGRSRLVSLDDDPAVVEVARRHLGDDARATFLVQDAAAWLADQRPASFDLIFADAWPGKYSHLDEALRLLRPGGLYVVDDLLPQPNWPDGHGENVDRLIAELEAKDDLTLTRLHWSTGIILAARL